MIPINIILVINNTYECYYWCMVVISIMMMIMLRTMFNVAIVCWSCYLSNYSSCHKHIAMMMVVIMMMMMMMMMMNYDEYSFTLLIKPAGPIP